MIEIIMNVSPAMPFDAVTQWAEEHSNYAYKYVPRYTSRKTQKLYQKWLNERS